MDYTIGEIARILGVEAPEASTVKIGCLLTDSRSLLFADRSLFIALRTQNNDGHKYVKELYDKGVRNFLVDHIPSGMESSPDTNFILVSDTLKALQRIGQYHRSRFGMPVVGITGSRGKTVVKEWLYQLLSPYKRVARSPRSFNSRIGVPLSVWEIGDDTEVAIIEAGISQKGEMDSLERIIAPEIGIITNIFDDHDDGFASRREKCDEKLRLMSSSRCVIYCADDAIVAASVADMPRRENRIYAGWSEKDRGTRLFVRVEPSGRKESTIEYSYRGGESQRVAVPFIRRQDIENAIACLALMLELGMTDEEICSGMRLLTPVGTRIDVMEGVNDSVLIVDSYTADFQSLSPAIDFMQRRRTSSRSSTAILSDMSMEGDCYEALGGLLKEKGFTHVVGIGPEMMAHKECFSGRREFYPDTESFLSSVSASDFNRELILIKGAPEFRFDRIVDLLEERLHETVLEVNLDAVVHNFNFFRSLLKPDTGIICMVKAFGYGSGPYEIAKTLQSQGAAYVAVAVCDEGIALRKAGITMPIMVMNPRVANYEAMFENRLEPEIYSFQLLNDIIKSAELHGIKNYPVHIKIDTGMHRLGFLKEDMPELIEILRNHDCVVPRSVFSHLAVADCPEQDEYTFSQFDYFDSCCSELLGAFGHGILRHILNSTGIVRFPDHQFDMVRLGIGLYGIPTLDDGVQSALRPVSSLKSAIISIKTWDASTTIGYGRRGVLSRKSKIATVPIGYADGVDRHLGNGGMSMWVNGHRCPTVGNICMDACMIDVTDAECVVGDTVEIFGPNVPAAELAETLGTIPYEILTSVSERVKRVYYRE